jgi:hypothetical protein
MVTLCSGGLGTMRSQTIALIVLFTAGGYSQNSASGQGQPCVIVKQHVHKFGENMSRLHPHRPYDYVEGDYPTGFKWRSELGDGDVRELQQKGGKMVVVKTDYETPDLEDARKQCHSQGVK